MTISAECPATVRNYLDGSVTTFTDRRRLEQFYIDAVFVVAAALRRAADAPRGSEVEYANSYVHAYDARGREFQPPYTYEL